MISLSIILGLAFGVALNRVGATNPENIINMLRLTDLSLMKTILFAVGFAGLLLFLGLAAGLVDPGHVSVKAAYWGVAVGGALLGIGFAIAGFCPGTGLAAAATGRLDAWVFVVGGLLGAFAYMLAHEAVAGTGLLEAIWGGKVTLAATGNESFKGYLPGLAGAAAGAMLMAVAAVLPKSLR